MTASGRKTANFNLTGVALILGGARSGKSAYGEGLIALAPGAPAYIATAESGDQEMADRIRHHRERRGEGWRTIEAPLELAAAIAREKEPLLVDCLTLWLSNLMAAERDIRLETDRLTTALRRPGGPIVLISNEVGLGIVPDNALARRFRDEAGRLHQRIAEIADRVLFVAAGLPLALKGELPK